MKFTTIKGLKDERAAKVEAQEALIETAKTESRDMTEDEFTQFEAIAEEVRALDRKIGQQESVEAFKRSRAAEMGNGKDEFSPSDEKSLSKFSLSRALSLKARDQELDGVELEVSKLGERSAQANNIEPTTGSFCIPTEFLSKRGQTVTLQTTNPGDQGGVLVHKEYGGLIDQLWSNTWLDKAGATFLSGLVGDQVFPVQTTKPAVVELTEIQEDSYSEILFSDIEMKPTRRGVTIPLSKRLLMQSSLDVQNLVTTNISRAVAEKLNVESLGIVLAVITSGNNNLVSMATNGGDLTYAKLVELEASIDSKDALVNSPVFLINTKTKAKLRLQQIFAGTNGQPVYGTDNTLLGYRTIPTNLVPSNLDKGTSIGVCSAVVFGNFSDLYVGIWDGVEFIVDPYTKKRNNQIEVTANTHYGIKVARNASFAGIKDVTTVIA